jgi:hypothetical protein
VDYVFRNFRRRKQNLMPSLRTVSSATKFASNCQEVVMNATTCELMLSEEERELIVDILEERQRTLLVEIAHTDHHSFQAGSAEES